MASCEKELILVFGMQKHVSHSEAREFNGTHQETRNGGIFYAVRITAKARPRLRYFPQTSYTTPSEIPSILARCSQLGFLGQHPSALDRLLVKPRRRRRRGYLELAHTLELQRCRG